MEDITYAGILAKFERAHPETPVEDYRPADHIPFSIVIWSKRHAVYLVKYDATHDLVFILSCECSQQQM